ncbi:hypothetical protein MASR1M107_32130 [Ignavibacteriales bacterium]
MENIESKVKYQKSESTIPHRYAVVDNPVEIEILQTELRDKFLEKSDKKHKVGKLPIDKYVDCQLNAADVNKFWYLYNLHIKNGSRQARYWNILGSGDTKHWRFAELELNIPKEGIDRKMQAAFVKDEEGKRYLVHRGGFRGKKKAMTRKFFIDRFKGKKIVAGEGEKLQEFAVIACLNDKGEKFIQDVAKFLNEVKRIKAEFNNL